MTLRPRTIGCGWLLAFAAALAGSMARADDWPCFGHDPAHTSLSSERASPRLEPLWERVIGPATAQPVVAAGRLYVGNWAGRLLCLDAATGEELWHFDAGDKIGFAAAVSGGLVVFGSDDGSVYALDAATGERAWAYGTQDKVWSAPAIVEGLVYVGSNDHRLYALDLRTGAKRWEYDCGSEVWCSPAVAGGRVFVTVRDGRALALEADTGRPLWTYRTPGRFSYGSPSVAGDVVCFGTLMQRQWDGQGIEYFLRPETAKALVEQGRGATFFALDAATGRELWTWPREAKPAPAEFEEGGRRSWFWRDHQLAEFQGLAPAIADGVAYAHSTAIGHGHNAPVIAFDLAGGEVLWAEEFSRVWTGGHRNRCGLALTRELIFGTSFVGRRDGQRIAETPYGQIPEPFRPAQGKTTLEVYAPVIADGRLFAVGIQAATPAMIVGAPVLRAFTFAEEAGR